jgi:hypothetical protein
LLAAGQTEEARAAIEAGVAGARVPDLLCRTRSSNWNAAITPLRRHP